MLSRDDVTDGDLQRLQTQYSSLDSEDVIKRNFHDISQQLNEFKIHQLQVQPQTQQDESDTWKELQLTKRMLREQKTDYEFQIQQLKAQLKKQQVETKPGRSQSF